MSAIDNKHKLEILQVIEAPYPAKGDRAAGVMYKAQCVFYGGDQGVQVGQLLMPKHLIETPPGSYLAEFELAVDYKLQVVPRVTALHPVGSSKPAAPVAPAAKQNA